MQVVKLTQIIRCSQLRLGEFGVTFVSQLHSVSKTHRIVSLVNQTSLEVSPEFLK